MVDTRKSLITWPLECGHVVLCACNHPEYLRTYCWQCGTWVKRTELHENA